MTDSCTQENGWLIHKDGRGWYRPKSQGYTNSPAEAGRYSYDEAVQQSHPNGAFGPRDGMEIFHESKVAGAIPASAVDWEARAEKAEAEIERRNGLFNVETVGQIISALHTHNARLDAELATLRAKAEKLAFHLQNILSVYSQPDRQMCCDGRECGCMGSTVYDEAEHYARAALAEWEGKP